MLEVGGSIPSPPTRAESPSPRGGLGWGLGHPIQSVHGRHQRSTLAAFRPFWHGGVAMIRRALLAVGLTGLVAISGAGAVSANAPATHFTVRLSGAQEVPPTGSQATGTFDLRLTDNDTKLRF